MDRSQSEGAFQKESRIPMSSGLWNLCEHVDTKEEFHETITSDEALFLVDLGRSTGTTEELPLWYSADCAQRPPYAEETPWSPKPLYINHCSESDVSSNYSSSSESSSNEDLPKYSGFRRMQTSVPDLTSLDSCLDPALTTPHILLIDSSIADHDPKHREEVRTLIICCPSETMILEFFATRPFLPKLEGCHFDAYELLEPTMGSELNYASFFAAHSKTLIEIELNTIPSVWEILLVDVEIEKRLIENILHAMINLPNIELLSIHSGVIPSSLSTILPTCTKLRYLKLQCYKFDDVTETIPGALIEVFEFEETSCGPRRLTLNLSGMRNLKFLRVWAFRHVIVSDFNPQLTKLELVGIQPKEISFQGDCSQVTDLTLSRCQDYSVIVERSRRESSRITLPLVLPGPASNPTTPSYC